MNHYFGNNTSEVNDFYSSLPPHNTINDSNHEIKLAISLCGNKGATGDDNIVASTF